MKAIQLFIILLSSFIFGQDIRGVQLFNPNTNDETPVIGFNQQLILKFDDLKNQSTVFRYTIKHYDRNWQDDGLFFTEFAEGSLNGLIDRFKYSFNTYQKYTHYELAFPNEKMRPKISGNFELIVYKDSADKPLFKKRFMVVEDMASVAINATRYADARAPQKNQRLEIQAVGKNQNLMNVANSLSLTLLQNNNFNVLKSGLRPSATLGNKMMFQQLDLVFPGNNEFYYFDNKIINQPIDMVAKTDNVENVNHTFLYPVWAYPLNYQYQPDVNGAYYFRRNDLGIERDADREGDYSWVHFALDSDKMEKEIYVLGQFNDYVADKNSLMIFHPEENRYTASIYLKQGFYSYVLATKEADGSLNFGEINGNFWQTENLYQALLYYTPFGRNYDGIYGYGEIRKEIR